MLSDLSPGQEVAEVIELSLLAGNLLLSTCTPRLCSPALCEVRKLPAPPGRRGTHGTQGLIPTPSWRPELLRVYAGRHLEEQ